MIDPALYDQARDRIAANGFTPEIQTKITLLLCTAKNGNLMYHSSVQWMQNLSVVQQFILSQYSRELEAVTLLSRTTQWSKDPMLAMEGSRIVAPLMMAWGQSCCRRAAAESAGRLPGNLTGACATGAHPAGADHSRQCRPAQPVRRCPAAHRTGKWPHAADADSPVEEHRRRDSA